MKTIKERLDGVTDHASAKILFDEVCVLASGGDRDSAHMLSAVALTYLNFSKLNESHVKANLESNTYVSFLINEPDNFFAEVRKNHAGYDEIVDFRLVINGENYDICYKDLLKAMLNEIAMAEVKKIIVKLGRSIREI